MADVIQKIYGANDIRHGLASIFIPGSGMAPGLQDANRIVDPVPIVSPHTIADTDAKYTERWDIDGKLNKGFQTLTMGSGVGDATNLTVPDGAAMIVASNDGGGVRWRDDGTSPTDLIGHVLGNGNSLTYDGDLAGIEFISQGASSGVLSVSYYTLRNATNEGA